MNNTLEICLQLGVALLSLPLLTGLAYGMYYLLSLPLRREERTRLFLDLIEQGLRDGQGPEHTLQQIAATGDRSLGIRFHLLAAYLESGLPLDEALGRVPNLLPPRIVAMLRVGRVAGDFRRVLAACRQQPRDGVDAVANAQHYVVLLAFGVGPAWVFLFTMLMVYVFPRFEQIAMDMGAGLPPILVFLGQHFGWFLGLQIALTLFCEALALAFIAGPRLTRWTNRWIPNLADRLALRLPWRRRRLERDFTTLLATLLDAGVPEAEALQLAGEGTANAVFRRRVAAAQARLQQGESLPKALSILDDTEGFRWRFGNAAHGSRRFLEALSGWTDALSAKAYQLEQTAAQLFTTGLVVVNGIFVGLLAVGVFSVLIGILNHGVLW